MAVSVPTTVCTFGSTGSVTTSTAQALTAAVPLGALLMVTVGGAASSVTYGVSDSQGHTWSSLTLWTQATGTLMSTQVFYTKITTALTTSDTLTATRSNSNTLDFFAEYVTGQDPTTPIGNGGVTQNTSSSTSVTTLTVPSPLSAGTGDMTRGALVVTGNSNLITSSALTIVGSGVVGTGTGNRKIATGYRIATSPETPTPDVSWTTANAAAWGAYVIAAAGAADPWTYGKIAKLG